MKFWDIIKAAFSTEYGAEDAREESKPWRAPEPKVELDGGVVAGLRKALQPILEFIEAMEDDIKAGIMVKNDLPFAKRNDKELTTQMLFDLAGFAKILDEAPQWPAMPYGPDLLRGLDDYTVQRCASIARIHAHHALWRGVAEYGTYGMDTNDKTLEQFGQRLAHRIADQIVNEPNSIVLRRQGPRREKPTRESVLASHMREMFWHLSLSAAVIPDPVQRAEMILSLVDQAAVCAAVDAIDAESKRRHG